MDLPYLLESQVMVNGLTEKKQEMVLRLKQFYGTILHDEKAGTDLSLHLASEALIDESVSLTLSQVEDIKVIKIDVEDGGINVDFDYLGERHNLNLDLNA